MSPVKAIPEGFTTITPHLVVDDTAKAIEFYTKAFGATHRYTMPGPDGRVMHAEVMIGDSILMLCDSFKEYGNLSPLTLGGTSSSIHLYVENADEAFDRAVKAGATSIMPVTEMFWGDRYGKVSDPFGHEWSFATHVKDMSPEEMKAGMAECMKAAAPVSV